MKLTDGMKGLFFGAAVFALAAGAGARQVPAFPDDVREGLRTMEENVYGRRPDMSGFTPRVEVIESRRSVGLPSLRKRLRMNTMTPLGERTFEAMAYFPVEAKGRVPVFVYISYGVDDHFTGRWPVKELIQRGCATASFSYWDVLPDQAESLAGISRGTNDWGAISTWALAASRVVDYLVTEAQVDTNCIAVVGHSRLGKTALWTGATDPRITLTCVNDSGCLGARLSTCNLEGGETIRDITRSFWYWFAPRCKEFVDKDAALPFDQHWVMAAVAPRLLAIGSADGDAWACPSAEFAGYEVMRDYYARIGAGANVDYHVRKGSHNLLAEDWHAYIDFAIRRGWPIRNLDK